MKRFLSGLLILVLALSFLPAIPMTTHAASESDLTFQLNSDGESYSLTSCDPSASGELRIPDTYKNKPVTIIWEGAFCECTSLSKINIPASVGRICGQAFSHCTSIWVDENNPNYSSDTVGALMDKAGITLIQVPANITDAYTIPDGVRTIDYFAFTDDCNFTAIKVPLSVREFKGFPSENLTDVYYAGTRAQWLGIAKSDRWEDVFYNLTIHYESHLCVFKNYISNNDATCLEDGTETAKCEKCDNTDTRSAENSRLGHSFIDYKSDNNATCLEDGTKTAKCDRCAATDMVTDTGSKLGHSFTNYISNNDATCLEDGTKTAKCNRCDEIDTLVAVDSKLGHIFINYISNNDATYDADGTKTAQCDRCDVTDTVADPGSRLLRNGWVEEGGKWCYYENNVKITNAWREDSAGWCYLGADGYCVTNSWQRDSIGWCYLDAEGRMVYNQWVKDSVGWCYIGAEGYMVTNKWVRDSQGWCYVGADGYCLTNAWMKDSIGWCYLDAEGRMVYNKWVADSKGWCYVGADGYMVTNAWARDSIGWYWMGSDGYAIQNTSKRIDGKTYYFNASGVCTNP